MEVTIEKLLEFGDVLEAIKWAEKQNTDYPKGLKRPILTVRYPNIEETQEYLNKLLEFKALHENYEALTKVYWQKVADTNQIIDLFIREESGLNNIPEQYREKVYSRAYADGHSCGYYDVYLKLCDLVEIFN